jgi:hypothetical protein
MNPYHPVLALLLEEVGLSLINIKATQKQVDRFCSLLKDVGWNGYRKLLISNKYALPIRVRDF